VDRVTSELTALQFDLLPPSSERAGAIAKALLETARAA
jgi:hypothetical protein